MPVRRWKVLYALGVPVGSDVLAVAPFVPPDATIAAIVLHSHTFPPTALGKGAIPSYDEWLVGIAASETIRTSDEVFSARDPTRACSRCGRPFEGDEPPIRIADRWCQGWEYRYHAACLDLPRIVLLE